MRYALPASPRSLTGTCIVGREFRDLIRDETESGLSRVLGGALKEDLHADTDPEVWFAGLDVVDEVHAEAGG